jgi:uncharacterized protein (TIGR02231 family)
MKNLILFVPIFICFSSVLGNNVLTTKCNVNKATVYLQGAQLYTKATFNLLPGYNDLIFQNVSPSLDQNSIQAGGNGNFVLVDAVFQISYKEKSKPTINNGTLTKSYQIKINDITDSIEEIDFQIVDNNNKIEALLAEKNILINNRLIKGEFKKDTLALLKDGLQYLREQLFNINNEMLKYGRRVKKMNGIKNQMAGRLQNYELLKNGEPIAADNNIEIHEIKVTVMADAPVTAEVEINYYCNNAGWLPKYEIRANGNSQKVDIKHLAKVYQNSGVDWNNANIILSTGNPSLNNTAPILSPYLIGYYRQLRDVVGTDAAKYPAAMSRLDDAESPAVNEKNKNKEVFKPTETYEMVSVNQSLLRTEYDVKLQYNIPSDSKYHLLSIQNKSINSKFEFNCVPKIDKDAFLMARLANWEELNLIPGDANLFFDGSFVGLTFIKGHENQDTLDLNLGRDKSFVVTRTMVKEKSKTRMVDNTKQITKTFEIIVKNTKSVGIAINVFDQLPISQDTNIKVELIDGAGATYDDTTGALTWNINLKPKENKKVVFSYSVKCPVGVSLALN